MQRLEQGYDRTIYEYINSLNGRDLLQKIWFQTTQPLQDRLSEVLERLGTRFYNSTMTVRHPVAWVNIQDANPWWFRIPKKLSKELEEDLRSEGILD